MVELKIRLNPPRSSSGFYQSGEMLVGHVYIHVKKSIKARCITLKLSGKARTEWTEAEHCYVGPVLTTYYIDYHAEIDYVDCKLVIWDGGRLESGEHLFQFEFLLPMNLPLSMQCPHGCIVYKLRTEIDRPYRSDNAYSLYFGVLPVFDLNCVPFATNFIDSRIKSDVSGWFSRGFVGIRLMVNKTGFVPGENMEVTVEIDNRSSRKINRIEYILCQESACSANRHSNWWTYDPHREVEYKFDFVPVIYHKEYAKIAGDTSSSTSKVFVVPPVMQSTNGTCAIIEVSYVLKIRLRLAGIFCDNYVKHSVPIVIGTIPAN